MSAEFYVNCEKLKELVEKLHPDTLVDGSDGLTIEEFDVAFTPPLTDSQIKLSREGYGGHILASHSEVPRIVDQLGYKNYKIVNIYETHCGDC